MDNDAFRVFRRFRTLAQVPLSVPTGAIGFSSIGSSSQRVATNSQLWDPDSLCCVILSQ